jgi:hypothetical protein
MKRVTFVEKTAGEVGDGTDFPMLVTLDQLAEIMYRVRDAWFTAGSLEVFGYTLTIQAGTTYPLASSIIADDESLFDTEYFYARGYNVSGTVAAAFVSYFAAPYAIYSTNYQDCDSEVGIWFPDYGILGSPIISRGGSSNFRCGFSHIVGCSNSDPWSYIPPDVYTAIGIDNDSGISNTQASLWVDFTGEVAYVGDNPLDPAAELYLGVEMNGSMAGGGVRTKIDGYHTDDTGANFVLGLAGGDSVSCKLYSGVTHDSVSDFVLQAQRWWPYADASGAVWDEDTGLKL